MKQTVPLCLASSSPRRRELLRQCGLAFHECSPHVDETPLAGETAEALVSRLAWEKARAALSRCPDGVILAADTVVVLDGGILGKPGSPQDAAQMLGLLSGRTHLVITGYCLLPHNAASGVSRTVTTEVSFHVLPPEWVRWYSHLPEAQDKAGAYAIQGRGCAMVSRIQGSYTNVVGLPVESVIWDLLEQGWLAW